MRRAAPGKTHSPDRTDVFDGLWTSLARRPGSGRRRPSCAIASFLIILESANFMRRWDPNPAEAGARWSTQSRGRRPHLAARLYPRTSVLYGLLPQCQGRCWRAALHLNISTSVLSGSNPHCLRALVYGDASCSRASAQLWIISIH